MDLTLEHLGDMRPSTLLFHLTQRLLYTKWRDPGEEPKLHLFGQLKRITKQWLDTCLVCKGGTYPALAHVSGAGRHGLQPHHGRRSPARSWASGRSRRCSIRTTRPARRRTSASTRRSTDRWETDARRRTTSTGSCSTATGRPSSAASPRRIRRCVAYMKNHNLGLEVPYRYGSETRKYLPDFIVLVDDGHGADDLLHLVVEIKGYRREDAKEKKSTMETYWVPA